jgi:BarA-like signal transduction histidine kinase
VTTIEPIPKLTNGHMPPFRVEVSGTLHDPRLRTEVPLTHVFIVAASGPCAAEVAGAQLFGDEAGRRRCIALPGHTVRLLADGE